MIYAQYVTNLLYFCKFTYLYLSFADNKGKVIKFTFRGIRVIRKGTKIMNSTDFEWIRHVTINPESGQNPEVNWLYAALCSALVGLSGLVPIVFLTEDPKLSSLRWMLSFAVGGLLGDVFLHLLPEVLNSVKSHQEFNQVGLCVLAGLLTFTILEKTLDAQFQHSV